MLVVYFVFVCFFLDNIGKTMHAHKSNPTGYSERVSQAYSFSNLQDCLLSLFGKVY